MMKCNADCIFNNDGKCTKQRDMTVIEKWKNDFKGFINKLSMPEDDYNGIMEYIDEVPNEATWIPVSERLPKLNVDVLVTDIHGNRFVHTLKHDSEDETFYWEDDAGFFVDFNDVIAWMSLPQSYKEESEDER